MATSTPTSFPSSLWTDLIGNLHSDDPIHRVQALACIVERYRQPLINHISSRFRIDGSTAEEYVHAFIAERVIEGDFFSLADRNRGPLRSYLITSICNFCKTELRKGRWHFELNEWSNTEDNTRRRSDSDLFYRQWAETTVASALALMEKECHETGHEDVWLVFNGRLVQPYLYGGREVPYTELKDTLLLESPSTAHNLLVTGKRHFIRTLRSMLRGQVYDDVQVDEELGFMWRILGGPEI